MAKNCDQDYFTDTVKHVVGINRDLCFLATTYNEQKTTTFFDGKAIMQKKIRPLYKPKFNKYSKVNATDTRKKIVFQ